MHKAGHEIANGEEFLPFAIKLNAETMIYEAEPEFDRDAWQRQLMEGSSREPEDDLIDLCATPLSRGEAVNKLMSKGHSRATAYALCNAR